MNFFHCSTQAPTLVSAITSLTQVPVQKFPFLFIIIIPWSVLFVILKLSTLRIPQYLLERANGVTSHSDLQVIVCYRSSLRPQDPKTLQLKDVVSLVDFASAELSYEKESGLRAILNRPKNTPPSLHSAPKQLEM